MRRGDRPRTTRHAALLLALALAILSPPASWAAAPGELDPSFGRSRGKTITPVTDGEDAAYAQLILTDGRIVSAGGGFLDRGNAYFAVLGYTADGQWDTTLGTPILTDVTTSWDAAWAIVLQSDGKVVVAGDAGAGTGDSKFGLVRYNPDGTVDTRYGRAGRVISNFTPKDDFLADAAIQADDKIVAVGAVAGNGPDPRIAVARYRVDGSLDPAFGSAGLVRANLSPGLDWANAVAIQPDGKIIVAGITSRRTDRFAVLRYDTDGSLDTTFGGDGIVVTEVGPRDASALDVRIQPDGRIVVAGTFRTANGSGFAVVRYRSDGHRDRTFGDRGIVTTRFPEAAAHGWGLALQSDGKIVLVGDVHPVGSTNGRTGIVRYLPDGTRDTGFGTGGRALVNLGRGDEFVRAIDVDATGKIVLSGTVGSDFVVARVLA